MTKLSVNVNKIATLRNARAKNTPNVSALSKKILEWGAHGITVHPRPDGRHIRSEDVLVLSKLLIDFNSKQSGPSREFNVEGYPSEDTLKLIESCKVDQCTFVPDPPEAITSNAGWNFVENEELLKAVVLRMRKQSIRVSLFLDVLKFNDAQLASLNRIRPDRIEFYTEAYADSFGTSEAQECLNKYRLAADKILKLNIGLNAGHDLNQNNLANFVQALPEVAEVSIGHALISEALEEGLEKTTKSYLRVLGWA